LVAVESVGWMEWLLPSLILWLVNGVIVAAILARLLIYGEPVTSKHSDASTAFWRRRKQADVDIARVSKHSDASTAFWRTRKQADVDIARVSKKIGVFLVD
jgi:hypothetical protein